GDGTPVGDVGELQPAAGLEHAADLGEHGVLVGAEVDCAVGDDDVGPAAIYGDRFGESFAELDVVVAQCRGGVAGLLHHLGCHVDPDDGTAGTVLGGWREGVEAGTAAAVCG